MLPKEVNYINAGDKEMRLAHLKEVIENETVKPEVLPAYSNNHIHTTYSFSPYSPSAAVWAARDAGLNTAGIMDHDSISGADEFRKAAKIAGINATCGMEIRVSLMGSPFEDRKINHPDQNGTAYMTIHSIRSEYFDYVCEKMKPRVALRNKRNIEMVKRLNELYGFDVDFERDVVSISEFADGGSITERHILFAFAQKMLEKEWSENGITLTEEEQLDARYKRLGQLKSDTAKFYVRADEELMTLDEAVAFAKEVDGILCYSYLGDVTTSVTGDKKAAKYEDEFIEELLDYMMNAGVKAVTFMPSRNTIEQLDKLMSLCNEKGLYQISGEDINQPGQSFICKQLSDPKFSHLVQAAKELVAREL